MVSVDEGGREGQLPTAKTDPGVSTNKHLTRLVRFSILQARRSSQHAHASKQQQQSINSKAEIATVDTGQAAGAPTDPSPSTPPAANSTSNHCRTQKQKPRNSPVIEPARFPFVLGGFSSDKERPSTEMQYEYSNSPGRVGNDIGVVDVPTDPPIMEDLSASLTLSAGEHSVYSESSSEEGAENDEDMDRLLAPDSGSGDGVIIHTSSSNEMYNSAEMYSSSSGNYEGSDVGSESSDSIMRRVEEEIANARKASNDAQARLAYFTQKQKDLSPVMTDSYSFDFENLETSNEVQSVCDGDQTSPGQTSYAGPRSPNDENFSNAMGVIGREFDSNSADVEEKVDIEVVLAPSQKSNPGPPPPPSPCRDPKPLMCDKLQAQRSLPICSGNSCSPNHESGYISHSRSPCHRGGCNTSLGSRVPSGPPEHRADDCVDIDEAVITAVFSEKSIESLPIKESIDSFPVKENLPAVFSEPSMDSLPTQPTQSSIAGPGSYSFQDAHHSERALSPASSQKRLSMLPNLANKEAFDSPRERQRVLGGILSFETDASFAAKSPVSALAIAASPSKLSSTPRDPSGPSYRERLENKLKILGSRYPASPGKGSSPAIRKEKRDDPASPKKSWGNVSGNSTLPVSPKETISHASAVATSPLGEAYDGLESRIKDLLARTLNPAPVDPPPTGEKDPGYQSSPSAELKAIKKLLEQGVAAAAAAEEKKRDQEECQAQEVPSHMKGRVCSLSCAEGQETDLTFPELSNPPDETSKVASEASHRTEFCQLNTKDLVGESAESSGIRLFPRASGRVPAVIDPVYETKDLEPEPSVTCSTSEEILEQLDSFSQSREFKSSRKTSNAKRSISKPSHDDDNVLNGKDKEVIGQHEINADSEASRDLQVSPEAPSRGSNLVSSLKSYFDKAMKTADPEADESVLARSDEEGSQGYESKYQEHTVHTIEANAIEQNEEGPSTSRNKEEEIEFHSDCSETESAAAKTATDEQQHERSDDSSYADAAEGTEDTEAVESTKGAATSNQPELRTERDLDHPSTHTSARQTKKKSPSVLNAALCHPSLTDVKDRLSEKRGRQQESVAVPNQSTPVGCDNGTLQTVLCTTEVVQSCSQATEVSADLQVESAVLTTKEDGKGPHRPFDSDRAGPSVVPAQTDEDAAAVSLTRIVLEKSAGPTDEVGADQGSGLHSDEEKNMFASLVRSSSKDPQRLLLPPKPARDLKDRPRKGGKEYSHPPPRAKAVVVQSHKSSSHSQSQSQDCSEVGNKMRPSGRQDRKIRFRDPYPTPQPCRKPRSTEEIKRDHCNITSEAERKTRWKEPKGDLKRLLVAALDSSVSRRSNACGALKVISKLDKNKFILVRTRGFLEALVFVATDEINSDEPEAKEDARARAISCIYNVSHVRENRLIVCTHRGLLECLVKTINEDRGEARMEACGVMAQLAKSSVCRDCMVQVDELLSTLASVLKGTIDPEEKMLDVLSEDVTEDIPSSYSEMSSVLSEEQLPFPKTSRDPCREDERAEKVRANCSIRKQKSDMYDQYFELARLSSCAALIHLSKQCSILDHFCSNMFLLESIIQVARDSKGPLHGKCLEMLCNVSRLPANTTAMTRFPGMVDTLLNAGSSRETMDRVWAIRTLQNMTSDATSKATMATSTLLTLLINCVTSRHVDEQHAAMATLLNLSTDPSAVVPITSTKNVLATLVYLAHNAESTSEIKLMACNALATIGLWLQTVSGFGSIPEETRRVMLPSHKTTGWDIWD